MKPVSKKSSLFLSKDQWFKIFLAMSIITIVLYISAMICSLCGSKIFILNYQNDWLDMVEEFLLQYRLLRVISICLLTINYLICLMFVVKGKPRFYEVLSFPAIIAVLTFAFNVEYSIVYTLTAYVLYIAFGLIRFHTKKSVLLLFLKILIVFAITLFLEFIIYIIKSGEIARGYNPLSLSAGFVFSLENDIALSVMLYTMTLLLHREKGDSKSWTESQFLGGSSQTSKTQLLKSLQKNLTKTQKNKLRWLYAKMYLIQLGTFLLVMILPFLLGKTVEFLVMYLSFAITRYILGFSYSLHFKKESLCISASVIVFGILSLAVPFFYVVAIVAIFFGVGLAILLHLSYKYKSLWLINQAAKPDKFALLYAFFDGDLSERHVKIICQYHGLDHFQSSLIYNYMRGEKISVLAFKFNYSQRMIIYKLDESIDKLLS